VNTAPAFELLRCIDDEDFPERAAYARALLTRTVKDMRSTATFLEKRLRGDPE
jgi:hypothetical protein